MHKPQLLMQQLQRQQQALRLQLLQLRQQTQVQAQLMRLQVKQMLILAQQMQQQDPAQQEPEPIRALAHRLKGTCGNAQAAQLSEIAKLLQFAMAAGELEQAPGLIKALDAERLSLESYLTEQGY